MTPGFASTQELATTFKLDHDKFYQFVKGWWVADVYNISLLSNGELWVHAADSLTLVNGFKKFNSLRK